MLNARTASGGGQTPPAPTDAAVPAAPDAAARMTETAFRRPHVTVTAIPGGWMVVSNFCAGPLVFRSGGRAEAQARRLARWAASGWGEAELILQDARGALVAALRIAGEVPQSAGTRRAA